MWRRSSNHLERVEDYDVDEEDIGKRREAEVIILKRTKHDHWDDGGYQEYEDDETTRRYRREVEEINAFLETATISVDPFSLRLPRTISTYQRRLRRIFTRGSFTSGGRLFDGFWQSMEKDTRISAIRIDGERVVELDYGQMAPRLIYGLAGKTPPDRDLYAIDGIEPSCRDGVKKLFNAMLFTDKPLTKKPQGTKALLPKTSVAVLSKMIIASHPDIEPYFHSNEGHYVQFVESEIMVRVLLNLKGQAIVGLPVHDGLLVKRSEAGRARDVMEKVGEEVGGIRIPVEVEGM